MGFLDKLFVKKDKLNADNLNQKLNLGGYFYLMSYSNHYAEFLVNINNRGRVIAELFVFRAWVTQLGFRLFSTQPALSEIVIGEVFNQGKLGKGMLKQFENVDIEKETNKSYIELIDSRWQEYDKVFINSKDSGSPFPTREICGKLTEICEIYDPMKFMWICTDLIKHLDSIKQEAISTGLFK